MEKSRHTEATKKFFVLLSVLVTFGNIFHFAVSYDFPFSDAYWRWQECCYVRQGIDPFAVMNGTHAAEKTIGSLSPSGGTVPWAYLLGNLFNPCWMPFLLVKAYLVALYFGLPLLCCLLLPRYLLSHGYVGSEKAARLGSLLVFAPSVWATGLFFGNQSGPVCCLIILSMLLLEEQEIWAGVLLGFAMCKPQIAAVFFLPLLLRRKWKAVGTAVFLVLAAWGWAVWRTETNPLQMLNEIFNQGLSYTSTYYACYGLFNFLRVFGVSSLTILILDVAFALALFAFLAKKLYRQSQQENWLAWYALSAALSVLWFYKQSHDFIILSLLCLYFFCTERVSPFVWAALLLVMAQVYTYGIPQVLGMLYGTEKAVVYPWVKLLEALTVLWVAAQIPDAGCRTEKQKPIKDAE